MDNSDLRTHVKECFQSIISVIQSNTDKRGARKLYQAITESSPEGRQTYLHLLLIEASLTNIKKPAILEVLFRKFATLLKKDGTTFKDFREVILNTLQKAHWHKILLESSEKYFHVIPKKRVTLTEEELHFLEEMTEIIKREGESAISDEMLKAEAIKEAARIKSRTELEQTRIRQQAEIQKERMQIAERLKVAAEAHGFKIDDTTAELLLNQGVKNEETLIKAAKTQQLKKLRDTTSTIFKKAAKQYQRGDLKALENYARYLSSKFITQKITPNTYPPHDLSFGQIPAQDISEVFITDINDDYRAEILAMYNVNDLLILCVMNDGGRRIYQKEENSAIGGSTLAVGTFLLQNKHRRGLVLYIKDDRYDEGTLEFLDHSSGNYKPLEIRHRYSNRFPLSTFTTGDVTGNGVSEVIVATARGYSGSKGTGIGISIWNLTDKNGGLHPSEIAFTITGKIKQIHTVDFDKDGREEIITLQKNNSIQAYELNKGALEFLELGRVRKGNKIITQNNDIMIKNKENKRLWLIKEENGRIQENDLFHARNGFPEVVALPDIDGDGEWEFVGVTAKQCYLSSSSPTAEWIAYKQDIKSLKGYHSTLWGDVDKDGTEEVFLHTQDKLHFIDYVPKSW